MDARDGWVCLAHGGARCASLGLCVLRHIANLGTAAFCAGHLLLIFTRIHSHPSDGHRNSLDGLNVLWLNSEMVSW